MNRIRVLLVAVGVVMAAGAFALARPPANFDPALHGWFESLKQPGTGIGCCAESDCRILHSGQWRQTQDGYQNRVEDRWVDVPPDKVLQHEPNPTGSVVACWREGYGGANRLPVYIYCFVRGTEA